MRKSYLVQQVGKISQSIVFLINGKRRITAALALRNERVGMQTKSREKVKLHFFN